MKNEIVAQDKAFQKSQEYATWLKNLKIAYRQSQQKALLQVNSQLLAFYWKLGNDILAMQKIHKWGTSVIEQLSLDLKAEFKTSGFSTRNLWSIRRWVAFYTDEKFLHQAGAEFLLQAGGELPKDFEKVPWRHHVEIVSKTKSVPEARFYLQKVVENNWSRKELVDFIESKLFEREGRAITNFDETLPKLQGNLAQEILKDPYDFGFLRLQQGYDERDLEEALCQNITRFLLELGKGFAFIGRQTEIVVGGKSYFIDMLFYHIRLKCYVVVELKVVDFEPEFAGKLNFYVNAVDNLLKSVDDKPTIGLLICKSKDDTTVKWSFEGNEKPLGVAAYELKLFIENATKFLKKHK